jgi:hypothetical protein
MNVLTRVSLLTLLAQGCGTDKAGTDSGGSTASADPASTGQGPGPDDPPPEPVEATALFEVVGVPFDVALAPDGRVFVSVTEHAIDVWDPATGFVETHTDDAGSVFGIHWHEGTLWYTTSNHRQSGALMRLDGRTGTVIATEAGTTVFREPRDLTLAPDGAWVLADTTVGALFVVRDAGASVEQLGVPLLEPSSLAADESHVYAGGTDGVVRIPWPGGTPEQIDAREVNGLHVADGVLWGSSPDWGVFKVGTDERLDTPAIRRPGRLTGANPLLVTDWAADGVWAITPDEID